MEQVSGQQRFWCYECSKYYNIEPMHQVYSCFKCDSPAIEVLYDNVHESEEDSQLSRPSQFEIFTMPEIEQTTEPSQAPIGSLDSGVHPSLAPSPRVISIVTTTINDFSNLPSGSFLGRLLSQLSRNGGSRTTAATEEQIAKLTKIQKVKECAICQQDEQSNEKGEQTKPGLKLFCRHQFHNDCIKPWFSKTNTCPVCRKGLNPQTEAKTEINPSQQPPSPPTEQTA